MVCGPCIAGAVAGGGTASLLKFPTKPIQWLFWASVVLSVAWLVKAWLARRTGCTTCRDK